MQVFNADAIPHLPNLLIVDDSSTNLKLLQDMLRGSYRVFTAPTGQRALNFLQRQQPDAILLDIEMPEMNGFDVLSRLKENAQWSGIPVIIMTGHEDQESESRALLMGAVDYLRKPLSPATVNVRIQVQLELMQYRRHLEELVLEKTSQISRLQDATLSLLADVVEFRDRETGDHTNRTTAYVALLVNCLPVEGRPYTPPGELVVDDHYRISERYASEVISTARLHDLGKVGIPDAVLLKPGSLDANEFALIKLHPQYGADLLDRTIDSVGKYNSFFNVAHEINLSHHEKWDGTGYPKGLAGFDIPLGGRIMAIADVYDAMISERPYKPAYSHDVAMAAIAKGRAKHFDPLLVDFFMLQEEHFRQIGQMRPYHEHRAT